MTDPLPVFSLDWWRWLLEPLPSGHRNHSSNANRTGDVFCRNCIGEPDQIACTRALIIAFLAIVTAGVAISRVLSLHVRQRLSAAKLALYYLLVLHLLAGSLEWVFGWTTQLSLFISYAKAIELLIICYFYVDIATKMLHCNSTTSKSLCLGSLFMMFVYFTLFGVLGIVLSIEPWTDCHAAYWIWFSFGQLLTVQLMVSSFMVILCQINRIANSPAVKKAQKLHLLSLLYVYETSAFADVAFHVVMYVMADEEIGCSGIFHHDQLLYSCVKLPYDIISFLLPVWAILFVFRPIRKSPEDSRDLDGTDESDDRTGVVVIRNYERRYRPLNLPSSQRSSNSDSQRSRNRRSGGNGAGRNVVRRVSSAPSMVPPSTRRTSVSRSHISSPLYPIPEEPVVYGHSYQERFMDEDPPNSVDNASTTGLVEGER